MFIRGNILRNALQMKTKLPNNPKTWPGGGEQTLRRETPNPTKLHNEYSVIDYSERVSRIMAWG